ncbi:SDR family oxidoreductase [Rhizobium sp. C1]|uniref:SDR family oxidoreductase n=1 Tax=Rhizobium sp. C1 TaxID=1349799 RepID=UPI001E5DFB5F|nr:SDR family oxidoreductase [Rhizobium sp. C1]MCD2177685.1 SDR family oxidoreductase [Rhizobium sp. C1]
MSDHVLPKKSALVTGGARRIGRAICDGLANLGFSIAVHANSSLDEAESFAHSLRDSGIDAVALQADLRSEEATLNLIRQANQRLGGLGVIVNNASVFQPDWVTDFERETWDSHFDVHVRAPSILAGEFGRLLGVQEKGLIVNIIDQRVWAPTPNYYSYMLSKAAMLMATKTMAMSLAPRIRVNAIGPGPTLPNTRQTQADFEKQTSALLLGKGPDLSEFARTIAYFHGAPSVTGQMIALDGGQHLAWETPDVAGLAE